MQEFCKTSEPVCYGIAKNKESVLQMVDRLNNPIYVEKVWKNMSKVAKKRMVAGLWVLLCFYLAHNLYECFDLMGWV